MSAQTKNAPARRGRAPKTEKPSRPTLTKASPSCNDRTPDGRFAKDNPGGPGNPHARHCARMLALLRASISDEEMVAIIRMLVTQALAKDVSAAKLVLSYKLGKPAPAPNPDQIDRDEWEHFQRDAINLEEVQQVLGSLPSKVGNDIARTALPIMTDARKEALAGQLVANLPDARKPTKEIEVATEQPGEDAPIANGKSGHKSRAVQSTIHDQRSTTNETPPIANRKSKPGQKGKAKPKKIKPEWLRQTARRMQKKQRSVVSRGVSRAAVAAGPIGTIRQPRSWAPVSAASR